MVPCCYDIFACHHKVQQIHDVFQVIRFLHINMSLNFFSDCFVVGQFNHSDYTLIERLQFGCPIGGQEHNFDVGVLCINHMRGHYQPATECDDIA